VDAHDFPVCLLWEVVRVPSECVSLVSGNLC